MVINRNILESVSWYNEIKVNINRASPETLR